MTTTIATQRLHNQSLAGAGHRRPEDVVSWFGAIQAQEYASAAWGIGLRLRDATAAAIDDAFDAGRILRTHVMRPTWHFVVPADIGWMLQLTEPRVHGAMGPTWRRFGADEKTRLKAATVFEKAVAGGKCVTRAALAVALERAGMKATGVRLALLTVYAELEGILCSGPREGRQMTYASLSARAPRRATLTRDEAIAALTTRFFRSHGPATVKDFAWWSGLTSADVKRGLAMVNARSASVDGLTYWTVNDARQPENRDGVHLLPNYDEYLVAYRDVGAVPRKMGVRRILEKSVVVDGEVVATWNVQRRPGASVVSIAPFRGRSICRREELKAAVERYGRFTNTPTVLAK